MMITNLTPGPYIQVHGHSGSTPWINTSTLSAGQVRYNPSGTSLEVYDGNSWHKFGGGYYTVGLTPEAERVVRWAEEKMREEAELKLRMKDHPGLQEAYERLEIMKALTLEEAKKNA